SPARPVRTWPGQSVGGRDEAAAAAAQATRAVRNGTGACLGRDRLQQSQGGPACGGLQRNGDASAGPEGRPATDGRQGAECGADTGASARGPEGLRRSHARGQRLALSPKLRYL